jgi:OOP family OmpA-OmpF porin
VECPFDTGARLNNICKARLDEVALRLKQDPNLTATVLGYSDSSGGDAANQALSQKRADAVKDYLVSRHGIDAARITTEGRGSADPVGDNATDEGRRQNRRAVVILKVG